MRKIRKFEKRLSSPVIGVEGEKHSSLLYIDIYTVILYILQRYIQFHHSFSNSLDGVFTFSWNLNSSF